LPIGYNGQAQAVSFRQSIHRRNRDKRAHDSWMSRWAPPAIAASATLTDAIPRRRPFSFQAPGNRAARLDAGMCVLPRPAPKETAQIGALLGRAFSYELIEAVASRPERELRAALGQLSDAGLLFCHGTAPHASYLFKHNKQNHSNCAPSAISPGCGASKVGAPKPATSSPQSIAGLPKDSTPPT
jgi:hypothetical protein